MTRFQMFFGTLIAYILLLLYTGPIVYMMMAVLECRATDGCTEREFNPGLIHIVTAIGGIVSALVVSKLAITKPKENPTVIQAIAKTPGKTGTIMATLIGAYLLAWLGTGLGALVIGVMVRPDVSKTLAEIGTTWLGLAVASAFAYFGLDPST